MGLNIFILILLSIAIIILSNFLIKTIFKIIHLKKYGSPPSTGMYYDAELGSINGEIDNRCKYICECCEKRFKTNRELKTHLRLRKIKQIRHR